MDEDGTIVFCRMHIKTRLMQCPSKADARNLRHSRNEAPAVPQALPWTAALYEGRRAPNKHHGPDLTTAQTQASCALTPLLPSGHLVTYRRDLFAAPLRQSYQPHENWPSVSVLEGLASIRSLARTVACHHSHGVLPASARRALHCGHDGKTTPLRDIRGLAILGRAPMAAPRLPSSKQTAIGGRMVVGQPSRLRRIREHEHNRCESQSRDRFSVKP